MAAYIEIIKIIVKNFVDEVQSIMSVNKVFLFGSYARGNATEDSDIDVYFILNSFDNKTRH
jgi:predicted nucleotidyltransferase